MTACVQKQGLSAAVDARNAVGMSVHRSALFLDRDGVINVDQE